MIDYLDAEQARREKFEADVLGRLEKLENLTQRDPSLDLEMAQAVSKSADEFLALEKEYAEIREGGAK